MTNLIKHWIFYVQQNQRIKHSFEMELNVLSRVQIISNPPTLSSIVHVTGKKCFVFLTGRLTGIFIGHFTYISMGIFGRFCRSFLPFYFHSLLVTSMLTYLFSIIMTGHIIILSAIFDFVYLSTVLISWQFQKLNF